MRPIMAQRLRALTAPRGQNSIMAFSSEVDTGSREENASKQDSRSPALIPSKSERLQLQETGTDLSWPPQSN
jgi:hypothetical protein